MTVVRRKPRQLEAPHQRALARWLDICGLLWCHVPNGGDRDARVGAELKSQGVKRGVPDCLIFTPPPIMPEARGTALELKPARTEDPYAEPTDEQVEWLDRLRRGGWLTVVAHGHSEAIETLRRLGYDERMRLHAK